MALETDWKVLDGVKFLVDSGVRSVPEFYVKPPEEWPASHQDVYELDIIDLSGASSCSIANRIKHASQELGFFQVINHGVDVELMDRLLAVAHDFFAMPLEHKMVHYTDNSHTPVRYCTSIKPLKEKVLDWSDNLMHKFFTDQEHHPWPEQPAAYREIAEEYISQASALAKKLSAIFSRCLGLEESHLEKAFGKLRVAFRLNYYPPCPQPHLATGLRNHSDVGGFTILLQDGVPGLQVKIHDEWKAIKPVPGALIVNIGDQLEILSNGKFKSIEHRALVNCDRARLSVPLFWDPSLDAVIAPIPELLDENQPPLYRTCTFGEYTKKIYNEEVDGKAFVDSLRVE